jgi:hypothetical protein
MFILSMMNAVNIAEYSAAYAIEGSMLEIQMARSSEMDLY